jgi:hypothetical protein
LRLASSSHQPSYPASISSQLVEVQHVIEERLDQLEARREIGRVDGLAVEFDADIRLIDSIHDLADALAVVRGELAHDVERAAGMSG